MPPFYPTRPARALSVRSLASTMLRACCRATSIRRRLAFKCVDSGSFLPVQVVVPVCLHIRSPGAASEAGLRAVSRRRIFRLRPCRGVPPHSTLHLLAGQSGKIGEARRLSSVLLVRRCFLYAGCCGLLAVAGGTEEAYRTRRTLLAFDPHTSPAAMMEEEVVRDRVATAVASQASGSPPPGDASAGLPDDEGRFRLALACGS